MPAGGRPGGQEFGDGTVIARVDTLEQAVIALTRVQVSVPHTTSRVERFHYL